MVSMQAVKDDNVNIRVRANASGAIKVSISEQATPINITNVDSVDLVDEVSKAVVYGVDHSTGTELPVRMTDEGNIWIKNIQDVRTLEDSSIFTWPDGAPQYYGYEHIITLPTDYVYDKHMVYVANPSPDTALNLSIRNGVDMFAGHIHGEIYNVAVPKAEYLVFPVTAWSSCFTSINGVLADYSAELNDNTPPGSGDVPFAFAAVNDAIYFGAPTPFERLRIRIIQAAVYDGTMVWELWNGSAWVACSDMFDTTDGAITDGSHPFTITGSRYIQHTSTGSWTSYDIPSDPTNQYWIRCRVTALNSVTTTPTFSQAWYKPVGKANVHGYLVEGIFNGDECKITLENATSLSGLYGFNAEVYIRSV